MIRLLPYNSFVRGADLSNFVDDFFDKSIQSSNGDIFKMDVVFPCLIPQRYEKRMIFGSVHAL